jgi:hypothetical protein
MLHTDCPLEDSYSGGISGEENNSIIVFSELSIQINGQLPFPSVRPYCQQGAEDAK